MLGILPTSDMWCDAYFGTKERENTEFLIVLPLLLLLYHGVIAPIKKKIHLSDGDCLDVAERL